MSEQSTLSHLSHPRLAQAQAFPHADGITGEGGIPDSQRALKPRGLQGPFLVAPVYSGPSPALGPGWTGTTQPWAPDGQAQPSPGPRMDRHNIPGSEWSYLVPHQVKVHQSCLDCLPQFLSGWVRGPLRMAFG